MDETPEHSGYRVQVSRLHIALVGAACVGFGVFYAAIGSYYALAVVATSAVVLCGALLLPLSDDQLSKLAAGWVVTSTLAVVAVLGGPSGPNVGWALAGAMMAVLLLGSQARWGIAASTGGLLLMLGAEAAGVAMPYDIPAGWRGLFEPASVAMFTLFIGAFLYSYLTVFERQNELLRAELESRLRAEQQARSADRLKSQFLASMSHELRTPMNGVLGTVQILKATAISSEQRRYTGFIESSGQSLMAMLNEILDFSKIEAGRLELEQQPVALVPLAEEVAALIAGQAYPKGVTVHAILDPAAQSPICADQTRIRQILINLLSNAVKFTECGYVVLRLEAEEGRRVFLVEDTGVGMPPEAAESIFEPFQQAESTTSQRYGGTGLGLTIARELARKMGGDLELRYSRPEGSCFAFWLPADGTAVPVPAPARGSRGAVALVTEDPLLREAALPWLARWGLSVVEPGAADLVLRDGEAAPGEVSLLSVGEAAQREGVLARPLQLSELRVACEIDPSTAEEAGSDFRRWGGLQTLVVDDHPINRVVAADLLTRLLGFRVQTASSGAEALAIAAQDAPLDVVFMDVQMPEMDGLETTRRLRAAGFSAPIVALTANAFAEDRQQALDSGMDAHISKPIHAARLLRLLDDLLRAEELSRTVS